MLQAVRVLAVAPVLRAARRLHIGRFPRLGPECAQEGRGMERPRAHLDIVRLQDDTALAGPVPGQREDEFLEGHGRIFLRGVRLGLADYNPNRSQKYLDYPASWRIGRAGYS